VADPAVTVVIEALPMTLPRVLAYGREYLVGTDLGPPLAFWLCRYRVPRRGRQPCSAFICWRSFGSVVALWAQYLLARAVVGGQQAVLAVLLTMTVTAFSSPSVEFGPLVLARSTLALLLPCIPGN